ncbi:hypothetical protein [Mesonia sp. K7]|uniref:hypothetical protein n=1 Tax=Mesonia sp. K7 TaxID=2218606 RepID=UPI000DA890EC|nr:hypothetical protein [Mesonia sp. K7]PZD78537.1 hypothetical protein DNG35_05605 [Mesonia sp. K7]
MIWAIIILVIVVLFIYNGYKGNKDIKNVERYGGLEFKYGVLIQKIMSNEKLKLRKINSNNLEIGYSFAGGGYVMFKLIEMSGHLTVRYESKDMVDGVQKLAWKFREFDNQVDMFDIITKDLTIHNLKLGGLSEQEASRVYQDMVEEDATSDKNSKEVNKQTYVKKHNLDDLDDLPW